MAGRLRCRWMWIAAYLVSMSAVVAGIVWARGWAYRTYGTAAARAEWQNWRSAMAQQADSGAPVRRRVPNTVDPPPLILLRDYFHVCLILGIVLGTALFVTLGILVRGVIRTTDVESDTRPTDRLRALRR